MPVRSGLLRLRLAMTLGVAGRAAVIARRPTAPPSLRGGRRPTKQSSLSSRPWIASPSARNDGWEWIASPSARDDDWGCQPCRRHCAKADGPTVIARRPKADEAIQPFLAALDCFAFGSQ